jgi:predicted DCC family thiol-disulfide oxidoreductase YuxK
VTGGSRRVSRWTLIFDGDCRFCRGQVGAVKRLDSADRIDLVPYQAAELESYGVSRKAAEQAMHLVAPSGAVWSGAAAARELFRLMPVLRPLAWLFRVPGVMFVAERMYRWVARRRHRFGCESSTCKRGAAKSRPRA